MKSMLHGSFTFSINESLRDKIKDIPDGYGVYRIYSNSKNGELLYIGKAGTVKNNGTYSKQNLRKRLANKQDGKSREDFFREKLIKTPKMKLYIEWIIWDNDILPTYIEARLIQKYYSKYLKLPLWNKSF